MRKTYPKSQHGLGADKAEDILRKNHFASATPIPRDVADFIDQYVMRRVAGNVYECPSTKDFWKVQGNKIIKLVGNEVDNGESIPGAPDDRPQAFLAGILDDLEF
jgi:hypothetical protein